MWGIFCFFGHKLGIFVWLVWFYVFLALLTHWGRETHLYVVKLTLIGSDNGLSPGRRQAIIWTNAGILSNGPLGTNFSEILIEIYIFSFKKMHLKMSSGKWWPFCLGLNVLSAYVMWYRRSFWFTSNMHNSALRLTIARVSPDTGRIMLTTFCS